MCGVLHRARSPPFAPNRGRLTPRCYRAHPEAAVRETLLDELTPRDALDLLYRLKGRVAG
jgi:hypothetical protein